MFYRWTSDTDAEADYVERSIRTCVCVGVGAGDYTRTSVLEAGRVDKVEVGGSGDDCPGEIEARVNRGAAQQGPEGGKKRSRPEMTKVEQRVILERRMEEVPARHGTTLYNG